MMLSCAGLAQSPVRTAPNLTKAVPVSPLKQRYKTPAEQSLLPFLKTHLSSTAPTSSVHAQDSTSGVATPNFAGYQNAPMFAGRTTASLASGIFDTGVTVELVADFNKDGKPDVAVLQEDGMLNILTGDGAGNLSAPVSYLNPNQQTSNVFMAYTADVNGDGYPDVVAYDYANNATITWLNLGNGQFNAAVTSLLDTTNGYASAISVADVNGDGYADIVYETAVSVSTTSSTAAIEVQFGAGDGTFSSATAKVQQLTVPAELDLSATGGITLADLNGDGKLDLVLVLDENQGTSGTYVVTTSLGYGDGTFSTLNATQAISAPVAGEQHGRFYVVPFDTSGVYIADVNGDGKPDVISDINGTLYAALGSGDGTFATAVTSADSAVSGASSSALLDVNGDGKLDFVTAGGTMAIMLGNGDGTFAGPAAGGQLIVDPTDTNSLVVADFNGDGISDVAQLGGDYKQVSLFFGTGKTLRGAPLVTAGGDPLGLDTVLAASGKYTNSGYLSPLFLYDNLITGATQIYTGVNDGKGNFTSVQALAGGIPADLEYIEPIRADFNGDGLDDLVYANVTGDILVALANGDGSFQTPKSIGLTAAVCPVYYGAAGDLNGDGNVDLVIPYGGDIACGYLSGGASGYWVALGKGDGTFSAPVFTATGTELYSVALADMNGDGNPDLLINDVPFFYGTGYQLSLAIGNGDGTFGAGSVVESSYVVSDVATADINGDGKMDIVLGEEEVSGSDTTTAGIVTIAGNGDGTFNEPSVVTTGNFFYGVKVADMNNDGHADIVASLYNTNGQPVEYYGMVTLLGYGNGQFAAPYNQLQSLGSDLPQVGSFYADGAMDVMTSSGYGPALFIGQGGSTLALTTSGAAINYGDTETLTATLAASLTGRPTPSGTVAFYDGTTLLGTGSLAGGTATFTTGTLAVGTHALKAVYDGDANFNPNTSSTASVVVTTVAPAFSVTASSSTVSVTGGSQGVVTLNLAANASFSGAVSLSCSGMPTNGTCTVNPGSVSLAAGGSSSATLVIGTTGTHSAMNNAPSPWKTPAGGLALAALAGVFFSRRKRIAMLSMLGLALLLSTTTMLAGCGSSGNPADKSALTVTPGTYTVTITAAPATANAAATQTATVSVTVN